MALTMPTRAPATTSDGPQFTSGTVMPFRSVEVRAGGFGGEINGEVLAEAQRRLDEAEEDDGNAEIST